MKSQHALHQAHQNRQRELAKNPNKQALARALNGARILRVLALAKLRGEFPANVAMKEYRELKNIVNYFQKADIEGHTTISNEPGSELVGTTTAPAQFWASSAVFSALDQINPIEVSPNVSLSGFDIEPVIGLLGEGQSIAVQEVDFTDRREFQLFKLGGMLIMSRALLETSEAERIIARVLPRAVAAGVDSVAFSTSASESLLSGATEIPSGGSTLTDLRSDFDDVIGAASNAQLESSFVVLNDRTAARMALLVDTNSRRIFPRITARGGECFGFPVITGSGVPANTLVLIDGAEVLRAQRELDFSIGTQATIAMSNIPAADIDGPTAPEGSEKIVPLFQLDSAALRAIKPISFRMRKSNAVAFLSGLDLTTAISS